MTFRPLCKGLPLCLGSLALASFKTPVDYNGNPTQEEHGVGSQHLKVAFVNAIRNRHSLHILLLRSVTVHNSLGHLLLWQHTQPAVLCTT